MPDPHAPGGWFVRHLSTWTHHLPAALVVAALVGVFHHDLHWLDAIDGYAFFGIGNLTAKDAALELGNTPTVAVVLIDQKSHEDYYRERNPLNRCELKKDLEAIYALGPALLVVDLDLSPALPLAGAAGIEDRRCEESLKQLFMQQRPTRTVLMEPFELLDVEGQANTDRWREDLAGFVSFADPTLKVSYGLVTRQACTPQSMAATAFERYTDPSTRPHNCLEEGEHASLIINPGQYGTGLRAIPLGQMPSRQIDSRRNARTHFEPLYRLPVVFFGSGFGEDDTYSTPLGTMYGVEVHAASFMSLLQPTTPFKSFLGFVLDLFLGLLMGGLIEWSWHRYFALRFSSRARDRQWAPYVIIFLGVGFILLVFALTAASFGLLRHFNLWLSPIPIALGMLIESFFNSAVGAAVGEGYEQRQALVHRLRVAHEKGTESFAREVSREAEQRPRHDHGLRERAARFFYKDFQRLWMSGQYLAWVLLLIRRLAFFGLIFLLIRQLHHS
ncbi:CHASE2 domain-containing protein [Pseudomonas sp. SLFW]|uniref:CHASE2 domain-containing protein n=1 Tax=Pseudomonas sp. SLFW TaxID=2683259 RepID=UPI0014120F30|nr:CHASE2 domain-containing protein [Pseudomonas sp. SLFW]NBB12272.1 CHASE2 domain-containing protein [Pseudomonas sp. SLFW]